MERICVGCGQTPVRGWYNYDNSFSVRIAKHRLFVRLLNVLGVLHKAQIEFIELTRHNAVTWANAVEYLPHRDGSVEVLYSSHMIEHLDRHEAKRFLQEALRVLSPNGIIRIVVPDIRKQIGSYLQNGDADALIDSTCLTIAKHRTFLSRLIYLIVGERHHLWMYDGQSLVRMLLSVGFKDCTILPPGSTTISSPGELNLKREKMKAYMSKQHVKVNSWYGVCSLPARSSKP